MVVRKEGMTFFSACLDPLQNLVGEAWLIQVVT